MCDRVGSWILEFVTLKLTEKEKPLDKAQPIEPRFVGRRLPISRTTASIGATGRRGIIKINFRSDSPKTAYL